jgi:hypothetical protein
VGTFKHYLALGQSLPDGSQGTPPLSTVSEVTNAYIVATDGTIANELKSSTIQRPHPVDGLPDRRSVTIGYLRVPYARAVRSVHRATSRGGSSGRYEQAIATDTTAHAARVAAGDTYTMPWINWFQGEADQTFGTTRAAYRAALLQLMADYAADIMAITGQATPPK